MNKKILITGTVLGILGILLGAFAAHGLKDMVSAESMTTFETGVRYQMYHALFLLIIGFSTFLSLKAKKTIWILVILGLIFFSGSIYGLATNELTRFDFRKIALITPIGGLLLIISWAVLLINLVTYKKD